MQYGNGIAGLDGIKLKIEIVSEDGDELVRDYHGNVIASEKVENGKITVDASKCPVKKKYLKPVI